MIRVTLIHRAGRPYFEARWKDPTTGRKRTESTECAVRRDAERYAARLELELNSRESSTVTSITWKQATEFYAAEMFPSQAKKTSDKMRTVWAFVEDRIDPGQLSAFQERHVGQIVVAMQAEKRSGYTIQAYLSKLRTFFAWAVDRRYLAKSPAIKSGIRGMAPNRGRAVTREEFERMLKAAGKVVGREHAKAWRHLLIGLWHSGLRLDEAIRLSWTSDDSFRVDLSGKLPMFRIQAKGQKNREFTIAPMVPAFYRFLMRTPPAERRGFVFSLPGERAQRVTMNTASKVIADIGKKARVKVSVDGKATKFASAHDLRRAFGERWADRVNSITLMRLMRHKSVSTTEKFYARKNAESVAEQMWRGVGHSLGNGGHSERPSKTDEPQKTAEN